MPSRLLNTMLVAVLVVAPLCAQQRYRSSAGYGSAYGWGYNDWTRNGWHNGQWHGIPYSDDNGRNTARESSNIWQGYPYRNTSAYYPYWGGGYWYPWRDASSLSSTYHGPYRPADEYSSYPPSYSSQVFARRGASSATYANPSEVELIQQQVARRRAQRDAASQQAAPTTSPQKQ